MALSSKTKEILAQALASRKASQELQAAIASDAPLSAKQLRELEIMLADKKAAADIASAIDAASGSISDRSNRALQNAMITKEAKDDLKSDIES
jgi:hypothetical protein